MRKFFKNLFTDSRVNEPEVCDAVLIQDEDLLNTYIKIPSGIAMMELVAIQDWIRDHKHLRYDSLPIATISGNAESRGITYLHINSDGLVYEVDVIPNECRELTLTMRPKVAWYEVEPACIKIGGVLYDKEEVFAAVKKLKPKERA